MLAMYASMRLHNVFNVSLLKKYVSDHNHIIDWIVIQMEHEGDFLVEPVHILDWKVKVLRNKSIVLVKVQCTYYYIKDTTWEHKETMRAEYPQILASFEEK